MKIIYNGIKISSIACSKKPRLTSNVKGATWDSGIAFLNDVEIKLHIETSWGKYIYFQYPLGGSDNKFYLKWYKIRTFNDAGNGPDYDIDPFASPKFFTEDYQPLTFTT